MIDLEALEWRIAEKADKGIHVAPVVRELIAELKEARKERAAVVAWLRAEAETGDPMRSTGRRCLADAIERGEHRKGDT